MNITTFDDLLAAARQQAQPQRLLLVFAGASLPDDATPAQRAAFEAGESGELAPLMCVDKDPHELAGFAGLVAEAATLGPPWALVFAGALSGSAGQAPAVKVVEAGLSKVVDAVRSGEVQGLIAFDREGHAVQLR
jgi:hypothetical protein